MRRTRRTALAIVLGCAALLAIETARAQNTGSLTLETTISGAQVVPKLSWTTTPAATSCTASGDWSGTKAASGTETLAAIAVTAPKNWTLTCNWPGQTSIRLSWTPPTQNTDNSALPKCTGAASDPSGCLSGYRIEFGTAAGQLTQSREHNVPLATGYDLTGLTPNTTYHVGIRTKSNVGAQSALTTPVQATTAAAIQWTQSVGFKVPNPPSAVTAGAGPE